MSKLKTPLRYPGGKSRVSPQLMKWIPQDVQEYREPFLGGGSMAIEFTKQFPDVPVWVNDKYEYLYDFWITLQNYGDELSDVLQATKLEHPTEDLHENSLTVQRRRFGRRTLFEKRCAFLGS